MRITQTAVVFSLLVLGACGGDDVGPPSYGGSSGGGSGGSGAMDATVPFDAGETDSSDLDAEAPTPRCIATDADRYQADTVTAAPTAFSLVGAPAGFGFAYQVSSCGTGVDAIRFPSGGGAFNPQTVVNGSGDCSRAYDPALYFADGAWTLFFWDNRGGTNQLWSQALDTGAAAMLQVASAESGRAPMLARIGDVPFLAWVEQSLPASDWTALYLRRLSDTMATPTAIIPPSAARHGFGFAISGVEAVGAVAWVDTQSIDQGAFLQPLSDVGAPVGSPVKLAAQVSGRSSVDLADGAMNAAVVYSTVTDNVAFEVRFRELNDVAMPTGVEERIVTRAERGTDASIAAIGNGYVVAYRALPAIDDGSALVRIILIDKTGRRLGDAADIATTTAGGGRVTVRSTFDGRFAVAWVEADGGTQRARVVRIPCR